MKSFSFKKFKKVKEDKDFAILRHEQGHSLKIAKKPLSPLLRKQLDHLEMFSDGGEVGEDQEGSETSDPSLDIAARDLEGITDTLKQAQPSESLEDDQEVESIDSGVEAPVQQAAPVEAAPMQEPAAMASPAPQAAPEQSLTQQLAKLPTQEEIIARDQAKDSALMQRYAEGTLNPNKFVSNSAANSPWIGIIISALGQAVGAGEVKTNVALDQLNKNTEFEIKRQELDDSKNLNLWKMNRQALGNDLAANLATKNQIITGLQYDISKKAQESKNALAIAQASEINERFEMQKKMNRIKLAHMSPDSPTDNIGAAIGALVDNDGDRKRVAEQADAAANTVRAVPALLENFDKAVIDARTGARAAIPIDSASQKAFKVALGPTISDIEGANRQSLQKSLEEKLTPQFLDFDETIAIKRKALIDYLLSKQASKLAQSYYVDFERYPETNIKQAIQQFNELKTSAETEKAAIKSKPKQVIQNGKSFVLDAQGNYVRKK